MASTGKKVTTAPESTQTPIHEGTGLITSDSLAAESVNQDGAFGENKKAAVSSQPSASTTSNVHAEEGANVKTLEPARQKQDRDVDGEMSEAGKGVAGGNKIAERAGYDGSKSESTGQQGGASTGAGTGSGKSSNEAETTAITLKESSAGGTGIGTDSTQHENVAGHYKSAVSSIKANENPPGRDVIKEIETAQKNLELPEQPPVAADWQSADARKVNLDAN